MASGCDPGHRLWPEQICVKAALLAGVFCTSRRAQDEELVATMRGFFRGVGPCLV